MRDDGRSGNEPHRHTDHGHTHYHSARPAAAPSSPRTRKKYTDPKKHLEPEFGAPASTSPREGTIYICPMHPEVRQAGPGACPICGMALEPEAGGADDAGELADMTRRFWIALALSLPVVVLDMGGHFGFVHLSAAIAGFARTRSSNAGGAVGRLAVFCSRRAIAADRQPQYVHPDRHGHGRGLCATASSLYLAPGLFPAAFRDAHGGIALYFEAAAVITVLVLLGQVLELRARASTSGALRALIDLAPKTARRVRSDGNDEDVPLDAVVAGDRLRVRPGEKVPADGVLIEGQSAIDESMVTGEAMPVTKQQGAAVIGGTLNQRGGFIMRADKVGRDAMLAHIVQMVAAAQRSRAPIQRLADTVASWFVPAVIVAALAAFAAWAVLGPQPRLAYALVAAVTVLIIACPCALGLATPMSIMVGVGRAASSGILIKNAEVLQRLEKVDTLVVDKTGTLTEGKPKITAIVPAHGFDENTVLRAAASVERASEHPLAAAIVAAAVERHIEPSRVLGFDSSSGKGAFGMVEGQRVVLGNAPFLTELGIATDTFTGEAERRRDGGATVVFVAIDGKLAGLIAIADPVKPTTAAALEALKAQGLAIIMLTGDSATTARAIARQLDITDVEAGVLPERKSAVIEDLRRAGHVVAMAGDGINDAPALAAADVGIAMGSGTDVAMASAGVTLVKGDLAGIARARRLSAATMRNIRQNLFFAFLYNAAGVPIAAGALYPIFGILLTPAVGAAAMALSSVSVVANALRLRRAQL